MKKLLKTCLLTLMIVSLGLPVVASDKVVFDIRVPSELPKAGEIFEVAVELSNNPGFCAIQFTLSYDDEALKCKDAYLDEKFDGAISAINLKSESGIIVEAASLRGISGDGPVAVFSFVAEEDITDYGFRLADISLVDENSKDISFEIVRRENEKKPGDSDNDDEMESQDEFKKTSFTDVAGHWAESFVAEAVERGLFVGGTDGNFHPDDSVTRAQFITVLWRMSGKERVDAKPPFADIETEISEFKDAIAWGYTKGYINGVSDIAFEPSAPITREAGMKILYLYSGGKAGGEILLHPIYDGIFKDSPQISEWAKSSVYWGIYNKLISGISEDALLPKGNATRAQLAKILVNYLNID